MPKKQQVLALLDLGWTYRRIETEAGVRRETVNRYDRARRGNAAKMFPGSAPPPAPDSPGGTGDDASKAAKTFAGPDPKVGQSVPYPPRPQPVTFLDRGTRTRSKTRTP